MPPQLNPMAHLHHSSARIRDIRRSQMAIAVSIAVALIVLVLGLINWR